jgi:23S rRNA (guanosine2251-2'-O)-methyltransferase
VEGRQSVRELLMAGRRPIREIFIASEMDQSDIVDDIIELAADQHVPIRPVSRRKLDEESHTEASQGVVAKASELPEASFDDLCRRGLNGAAPFLVALDGVTDPGNLGALLRTAEGAGVSGVILPKHRAVHVTPTVTKTAAGAIEHVPMALVGGLPTAITQMRAAGVWVVGLDADADTVLFDLPIGDDAVCLVVGAEGKGLSRLVRQRCDVVVSIPLLGHLGSLNVSVSAALGCYEIVRRRVGSGRPGTL